MQTVCWIRLLRGGNGCGFARQKFAITLPLFIKNPVHLFLLVGCGRTFSVFFTRKDNRFTNPLIFRDPGQGWDPVYLSFCSVSWAGGVGLWPQPLRRGWDGHCREWHFLWFLIECNVRAFLAQNLLTVIVRHHRTTADLTSVEKYTIGKGYSNLKTTLYIKWCKGSSNPKTLVWLHTCSTGNVNT